MGIAGRDIVLQAEKSSAMAFQAKYALGLDPRVVTGSREENASKKTESGSHRRITRPACG
jgi:hypothetical protein